MQINISDLLSTSGKSSSYEFTVEAEMFDIDGGYPYLEKKPVHLTLINEDGEKISYAGQIDVTLEIPCSRCLTPVPVRMNFEFGDELFLKPQEDEERLYIGDVSFVDGGELDADRLVFDEILMRLPMKVLCRSDCKGLCPVCGHNLNEGDCGCDRSSPDPRMSVIKDIFKGI